MSPTGTNFSSDCRWCRDWPEFSQQNATGHESRWRFITVTQRPKPLVTRPRYFPVGIPRSVVRFVVATEQFARAIPEPISVQAAASRTVERGSASRRDAPDFAALGSAAAHSGGRRGHGPRTFPPSAVRPRRTGAPRALGKPAIAIDFRAV